MAILPGLELLINKFSESN